MLRIHRWDHRGNIDSFIAEIDLANWMFGGLPKEIYAVVRDNYRQVHLGFPGDGMALIDVASTLPPGGDYYSLSLIGSTGAAYADDHHNMNLLFNGGSPSAIRTGQGQAHLLGQLDEFLGALREGRETSVTIEATAAAIDVMETVKSAAQAGRVAHHSGDGYELA